MIYRISWGMIRQEIGVKAKMTDRYSLPVVGVECCRTCCICASPATLTSLSAGLTAHPAIQSSSGLGQVPFSLFGGGEEKHPWPEEARKRELKQDGAVAGSSRNGQK